MNEANNILNVDDKWFETYFQKGRALLNNTFDLCYLLIKNTKKLSNIIIKRQPYTLTRMKFWQAKIEIIFIKGGIL